MRITAYTHIDRTVEPTGVGKHIVNMLGGLSRTSGIELSILASRKDLKGNASINLLTSLGNVPTKSFFFPRKPMQWSWGLFNFPTADRWCMGADWVYCPAESYVPTRNSRLAVTIHDVHAFETDLPWSQTFAYRKFRFRWTLLFKAILGRANLILTVSEFTKSRLIKIFGTESKKIVIVGNGVEDVFFREGAKEGDVVQRQINPPYIIVVGGLSDRKGGNSILDVAKSLEKKHCKIKIVVVGKSSKRYIERSQNHHNIINAGYVSNDTLAYLMKNSVALLHLSVYEGFGIPVAEAMAAGTPVIISGFAALPEIAGNAGILVDVKDTDFISDICIELLTNPEARSRYIRIGKDWANHYRWHECVSRLINALKDNMNSSVS